LSRRRAWFSSDVEAGEAQQAPRVVPRVDDLGLDLDGRAVDVGGDGQFVDVEPEGVERADALIDAPALLGLDELAAGEGIPQLAVPRDDAGADLDGVAVLLEQSAGLEVHQLAGDVDPGDLEVVLALPVAELGCSSPVSASTR
jgi:hypothetical protein